MNFNRIIMKITPCFEDLAAEWLRKKADSVKFTTVCAYRTILEKRLIAAFGGCHDVTAEAVQRRIREGHAAGLSRKTLRDEVAVLRQVLRYGHRVYGLPSPDWEVTLPREGLRKRLPLLTIADHRKLLAYLVKRPTPANIGVMIALTTGLRVGEVLGLRWEDADLRGGTIEINRTVSRIYHAEAHRSTRLEGAPKTRSSERIVPIGRELRAALRAVQKAEGAEAVYIVGGGANPKDPQAYRDMYYRLLRRVGIKPIVFHGLRHSFATRCIESGADVKTVSSILGHSNVATTMNLYVHPTDDQKRRCIDGLTTFINHKKRKLC